MITITHYLILSSLLFSIGLLGILLRRNIIMILMSVELMLNASNLVLVSAAAQFHDSSAQVFVFFVMVVAAAEVSVGLAALVSVFRHLKTLDVSDLRLMKW